MGIHRSGRTPATTISLRHLGAARDRLVFKHVSSNITPLPAAYSYWLLRDNTPGWYICGRITRNCLAVTVHHRHGLVSSTNSIFFTPPPCFPQRPTWGLCHDIRAGVFINISWFILGISTDLLQTITAHQQVQRRTRLFTHLSRFPLHHFTRGAHPRR